MPEKRIKYVIRGYRVEKNLLGKRVGRLTVIDIAGKSGKITRWKCLCKCGKTRILYSFQLTSKLVKSCGCMYKTHMQSKSTEYKIWFGMLRRCYSKKEESYPYYGGRGIKVCNRWKNFLHFLNDMGPRPSKDHSLDRINNKKGYGPNNCRWATRKEQNRNSRNCRKIIINGVEYFGCPHAGESLNLPAYIIRYRVLSKNHPTYSYASSRRFAHP